MITSSARRSILAASQWFPTPRPLGAFLFAPIDLVEQLIAISRRSPGLELHSLIAPGPVCADE